MEGNTVNLCHESNRHIVAHAQYSLEQDQGVSLEKLAPTFKAGTHVVNYPAEALAYFFNVPTDEYTKATAPIVNNYLFVKGAGLNVPKYTPTIYSDLDDPVMEGIKSQALMFKGSYPYNLVMNTSTYEDDTSSYTKDIYKFIMFMQTLYAKPMPNTIFSLQGVLSELKKIQTGVLGIRWGLRNFQYTPAAFRFREKVTAELEARKIMIDKQCPTIPILTGESGPESATRRYSCQSTPGTPVENIEVASAGGEEILIRVVEWVFLMDHLIRSFTLHAEEKMAELKQLETLAQKGM